jgi:AcrR family transcriptional regulator
MIDKGKPRGSKGQRTRQKLLSAAEREFGEKGYHAASISSITARARVAQGTFYFHFRGKEEIFGTLVREIGISLRKRMGEAVTTQRSRMAAERDGLRAFLRFAAEHRGLYRIVQESQFVDEAVYREYYERVAQGYARGLAAAAERGALSPGDAEVRAWAIMGIGHFLGLRFCLWRDREPEEQVIDKVMDFIAHGMAPAGYEAGA